MTFESFKADEKTVDAVLNNFMIMGEAARHIPEEVQAKFPVIPWAEMKDMRNFITHVYDRINLRVIWRTMTNTLPPLIQNLKKVLDETKDDPESKGNVRRSEERRVGKEC